MVWLNNSFLQRYSKFNFEKFDSLVIAESTFFGKLAHKKAQGKERPAKTKYVSTKLLAVLVSAESLISQIQYLRENDSFSKTMLTVYKGAQVAWVHKIKKCQQIS